MRGVILLRTITQTLPTQETLGSNRISQLIYQSVTRINGKESKGAFTIELCRLNISWMSLSQRAIISQVTIQRPTQVWVPQLASTNKVIFNMLTWRIMINNRSQTISFRRLINKAHFNLNQCLVRIIYRSSKEALLQPIFKATKISPRHLTLSQTNMRSVTLAKRSILAKLLRNSLKNIWLFKECMTKTQIIKS